MYSFERKNRFTKEKINDLTFNISPQSFFQTNSCQVGTLYETVKTCCNLSESDTLLDLYCGTGTIGLYVCHKKSHLIGIDEIPQAIDNAKENAALNNIKNTTFITGRVKNILKFNTFSPDCIVIDPPRSEWCLKLFNVLLIYAAQQLFMFPVIRLHYYVI